MTAVGDPLKDEHELELLIASRFPIIVIETQEEQRAIELLKRCGSRLGLQVLTWSLTSDYSNQFGGWTLDDVCLVGLDKTPRCGDGYVDLGEDCDDGSADGNDGTM